MNLEKTLRIAALAAVPMLAVGCSSTRYKDAQDEETINIDWGSTDLQTFSKHMADSFLESPSLGYLNKPYKGDDQRIIAVMGGITNETMEHINRNMITERIQEALLQSGRFRFVAGDQGQAEIEKQIRFQQGSGRVDPAKAIAFGKQFGAEVVMYGNLSSIEKSKGRSIEGLGSKKEDVFYQFAMSALNIETGEIMWTNVEELRKQQVTSLFGS